MRPSGQPAAGKLRCRTAPKEFGGWLPLGKSGSEEGGSDLGAAVGGVGEDQAGAEAEWVVGCLEGVAGGGHVVHQVGLPQSQGLAVSSGRREPGCRFELRSGEKNEEGC
jgi:hypothetical protein